MAETGTIPHAQRSNPQRERINREIHEIRGNGENRVFVFFMPYTFFFIAGGIFVIGL